MVNKKILQENRKNKQTSSSRFSSLLNGFLVCSSSSSSLSASSSEPASSFSNLYASSRAASRSGSGTSGSSSSTASFSPSFSDSSLCAAQNVFINKKKYTKNQLITAYHAFRWRSGLVAPSPLAECKPLRDLDRQTVTNAVAAQHQ